MHILDFSQYVRLKVVPVIVIVGLIALIPWVFHETVIDKQYCSKSKRLYKYNFKDFIKRKQILKVDTFMYATIKYQFGKFTKSYSICCSYYSKTPKDELYIGDITKGDTLYKKRNSNEFTIIKNGKHYIFEIDPDRKDDGSYKDHITFWDKISKIFD